MTPHRFFGTGEPRRAGLGAGLRRLAMYSRSAISTTRLNRVSPSVAPASFACCTINGLRVTLMTFLFLFTGAIRRKCITRASLWKRQKMCIDTAPTLYYNLRIDGDVCAG